MQRIVGWSSTGVAALDCSMVGIEAAAVAVLVHVLVSVMLGQAAAAAVEGIAAAPGRVIE